MKKILILSTALTGFAFGCASNADGYMPSPNQFTYFQGGGFDMTFLSFLEVDVDGNVNVSKLGKKPYLTAGCGGFVDITAHAKKIVFSGWFEAGAEIALDATGLRVTKPGKFTKMVDKVEHVTFSGARARARSSRSHSRSHLRSSSSRARLGTPTSSTRSRTTRRTRARILRATPWRRRRTWTVCLGSGWNALTSHSCCSRRSSGRFARRGDDPGRTSALRIRRPITSASHWPCSCSSSRGRVPWRQRPPPRGLMRIGQSRCRRRRCGIGQRQLRHRPCGRRRSPQRSLNSAPMM